MINPTIFTVPQTAQFIAISNSPTTIVDATTALIQVNSILITNTTNSNINFNLDRRITTYGSPSPTSVTARVVINKEVFSLFYRPSQNPQGIDLVEAFPEFLGMGTEVISDELLCYSSGPGQEFNVQINYAIVNQTP